MAQFSLRVSGRVVPETVQGWGSFLTDLLNYTNEAEIQIQWISPDGFDLGTENFFTFLADRVTDNAAVNVTIEDRE